MELPATAVQVMCCEELPNCFAIISCPDTRDQAVLLVQGE